MTLADRSRFSRRAAFILLILIAIPVAVHAETLEDFARELARKIDAALPAREDIRFEIRNVSSLKPDEVVKIEQALKSGLQGEGLQVLPESSGDAAITISVTLSENWKHLVWSAEIRQGETSRAVLIAVPRFAGSAVVPNTLPLTLRDEKFWEGPEPILDAGEITGISDSRSLVLLMPDKLVMQEPGGSFEIDVAPDATREPWGKLNLTQDKSQDKASLAFSLLTRECTANLVARTLEGCVPQEEAARDASATGHPFASRDLVPEGPPPPGKGIELAIEAACGVRDEFLVTGSSDYTQTDSVQVIQMGPKNAVPVSVALSFPGPVLALHSAADSIRAIVRNLTTGNYEAYRLAISCAQ